MIRIGARRGFTGVRGFATEAKAASEAAAPVVKSSSGGSSFFQRLTSFSVGFAVASAIGLYQMSGEVEKSTQQIQTSISALKKDMITLNKRIEQLEKRE